MVSSNCCCGCEICRLLGQCADFDVHMNALMPAAWLAWVVGTKISRSPLSSLPLAHGSPTDQTGKHFVQQSGTGAFLGSGPALCCDITPHGKVCLGIFHIKWDTTGRVQSA